MSVLVKRCLLNNVCLLGLCGVENKLAELWGSTRRVPYFTPCFISLAITISLASPSIIMPTPAHAHQTLLFSPHTRTQLVASRDRRVRHAEQARANAQALHSHRRASDGAQQLQLALRHVLRPRRESDLPPQEDVGRAECAHGCDCGGGRFLLPGVYFLASFVGLQRIIFLVEIVVDFLFLHFVAGGMARACLLYPVSDGCDFVCVDFLYFIDTLVSQRASGKRSNRCSKSTAIRAIFVRCFPRRSAPPFRTLVL
jgi:hypothetical protein